MLKPINLLLNKVKGKAKHLYPGQEAQINNLNENNVVLNNFTVVSSYSNKYKTDLTDQENVNAVEQAWASAKLTDLQSLQGTFGLGGLSQLLESNTVGGSLSMGQRVQNVYITLEDTSDNTAVINKVMEMIGYSLEPADYKLARPIADYQEYVSIVVKCPYLIGNIFVSPLLSATYKNLPSVSIPRPTYAATGKTTQLSLMELLLLNARPNGWQTEITNEEFEDLLSIARYPYVLYDEYYGRYDDGNVSYNSQNGCVFPAADIGYAGLNYQVFDIDRSDYIDFIDLASIDDLATVTTPGFYRVSSQFIYKYWLMVDDFETPNKDLFNLYSPKIWLSPAESGYRVNGNGDYGIPDPTFKYRGSYTMSNILMHDFSIQIRRIGE